MQFFVPVRIPHLEAAIAARQDDPDGLDIEQYDLLAQAMKTTPCVSNLCGTEFTLAGEQLWIEPQRFDMALQLVEDFDERNYEDLRDLLPVTLVFTNGKNG